MYLSRATAGAVYCHPVALNSYFHYVHQVRPLIGLPDRCSGRKYGAAAIRNKCTHACMHTPAAYSVCPLGGLGQRACGPDGTWCLYSLASGLLPSAAHRRSRSEEASGAGRGEGLRPGLPRGGSTEVERPRVDRSLCRTWPLGSSGEGTCHSWWHLCVSLVVLSVPLGSAGTQTRCFLVACAPLCLW